MIALGTAVRTLTVFRVPGREVEHLASSVLWFPLVGGLLGALLLGVAMAATALGLDWYGGIALLVLAVGVLSTGALHLDGLADAADGLFGGRDAASRLAIMKDPRVGSYGAVALVVVLLAKWSALSRLLELGPLPSTWLVTAYVLSRGIQSDLVLSLPYARAVGGTAAPYVASGGVRRLAAMGVSVSLCALVSGRAGVAAWVLALVFAVTFGACCRRRVGGITGDLLGAASELTETLVLCGAALLGGDPSRGLAP